MNFFIAFEFQVRFSHNFKDLTKISLSILIIMVKCDEKTVSSQNKDTYSMMYCHGTMFNDLSAEAFSTHCQLKLCDFKKEL